MARCRSKLRDIAPYKGWTPDLHETLSTGRGMEAMTMSPQMPSPALPGYVGRILHGPYSQALRQRVRENVERFYALEATESPIIHYMAAWHTNEQTMWYEFVSRRLAEVLQCGEQQVATVLRDSILDWRQYRRDTERPEVTQEVIERQALQSFRQSLRQASQQNGFLEAVYKLATPGKQVVWLKDQARVVTYEDDHVALALGYLTIISKEMELEEQHQRLLTALEGLLDKIKALRGLLGICATCKKIRDAAGEWKPLEVYIQEHTDVDFSHGICPECLQKALEELNAL